MNASAQLVEEQQRLLDRLMELDDPIELRRLAERSPEAREAAVIEALCREATKLIRVDLGRAGALAELAGTLAEELGDPGVRARALRAHANILHSQGEYESALDHYRQALEMFERSGDRLEAGITRSNALQALAFLGRHDLALEWADQARAIFESESDLLRLGRLDLNVGTIVYRQERFEEARRLMERAYDRLLRVGGPADVAHCLRNLATVYIGLQRFSEAEEVYGRARLYCEKEDLPLLLGEVEYNIAYLYFLRGEYTTAIELYRETRERCEASGELYHLALCDLDEGEIYLELNLIDEAVRTADAAHRRFEQLGMRYESAKALTYLAIARVRQGKTILGLELLDRARAILLEDRNPTWLGLIDFYKAVALAREGRRFEARGLAEAARAAFAEAGLGAKVAASEALMARLALQAGELDDARRLRDRALERLAGTDLPSLDYQVFYISGRIEEAAGEHGAALAAFEAAHRRLAESRSSARAEELKIPLLRSKLEIYESLVHLLGADPEHRDAEAVFEYMEVAKARNVVDLLAVRGPALPTRKARSERVERVRRLREELNWYYRRIDVQEAARQPSGEELAELRRLTRATEDDLAQSLREVGTTDPEYVALQTVSTGRIDEIRAVLPEHGRLIEFYVARDTVYAALLDRSAVEVVPVSLASRVREIQRRLGDQLLKFRLGEAHVERFAEGIMTASLEALHGLYLELFEPLEGRLESGCPLILVPHTFLHWLPFAALFDGSAHLVDRFTISYAPTATVFERCRTRPRAAGRETLLLAASGSALKEVEELAAALPDSRVQEGVSAGTLRTGAADARFLHLATEASFRRDNPMFSSIRTADGHLTLFDLYGLDLDAELTVLSGCGAPLEELSDGDELVGLARGLLYAGSRSVLLGLWNPPPDQRTELLAAFYRALPAAPSRAEALRRAMLEIRQRHPHPFYWASLVLIGDPGSSPG